MIHAKSYKTDVVRSHLLTFNIRPRKLCFVVDYGDNNELLEAIEEATTCWGGEGFPIIPIKGETISEEWLRFIEVHDPDVIVDMTPIDSSHEGEIQRIATKCRYEKWSLFGNYNPSIHALNLNSRNLALTKKPVLYVSNDINSPCAKLLVSAALGIIPENQKEDYSPYFDIKDIGDDATGFLASQGMRMTPIGVTKKHLSIHQFINALPGPSILVLSDGSSYDDLIYFWNLRATIASNQMCNIWLMPMRLLSSALDDPDIKSSFLEILIELTKDKGFVSKPDLAIYSFSLEAQKTIELFMKAGLALYQEQEIKTEFILKGREYSSEPLTFLCNPRLGLIPSSIREGIVPRVRDICLLERPKTILRFQPPESFKPQSAQSVMLDIEDLPFSSFPRSNSIAKLVHENALATKYGISLETGANSREYNLKINIPTGWDMFKALFNDKGKTIDISDKGKYAQGLLGIFDNELSELGALASPLAMKLINALTAPSKKRLAQRIKSEIKTPAEIDQIVDALGDTEIQIERVDRTLSQLQGAVKAKKELIISKLDELAKLGLVFRGLSIRCEACGYRKWYSIGELDNQLDCAGCKTTFWLPVVGSSGQIENEWSYALNELLARAVDQGVYPHLLSLRRIMSIDEGQYFLPGIVLNKGRGDEREVDIVAARDGRLIIGECKMNGQNLTEKDFVVFVESAVELGADLVLFACMNEWGSEVVKAHEKITSDNDIDVQLLCGNDLMNA